MCILTTKFTKLNWQMYSSCTNLANVLFMHDIRIVFLGVITHVHLKIAKINY